ncbi:MAG: SAM-dependent methyltransferase [Gammaproteobacteria bacterium]|nr:SAM-dependent methyltransferase [Gammaproteobacteria bacterium]
MTMPDGATRAKWDRASKSFDFMNGQGPEKRWGPVKRELFANMEGEVLFLALGTGLDVPLFPAQQSIHAIDISPGMVEQARPRVDAYQGSLEVEVMDVHEMSFPNNRFDQVFTSCTFCSVPDPIAGLSALRRVLKPGGDLYMFEHTGSAYFPFSLMMHLMTPLSRKVGPEMNRDTVNNVRRAGFELRQVNHVFLDVVKTVHAVNPVGN